MPENYHAGSSHGEIGAGARPYGDRGAADPRSKPAGQGPAWRDHDAGRRSSGRRTDDVVPILGMIIGGTVGCVLAAMYTGSRSQRRQSGGYLHGADSGRSEARHTGIGRGSAFSSVEQDESTDLIASNKVEGTAVYNRNGERLGEVYNFMVGKRSGRVAYAVMSFGGFLSIGQRYHALPWNVLTYDTEKGGYVIDADRDMLLRAPSYQEGEDPFSRSDHVTRIRDYWSSGRLSL